MHTSKARKLVLLLCLVSILFTMLACGGGGDCQDANGNPVQCYAPTVNESQSITEQVGNELDSLNNDISDGFDDWAKDHSAGKMECLSVFDANCE